MSNLFRSLPIFLFVALAIMGAPPAGAAVEEGVCVVTVADGTGTSEAFLSSGNATTWTGQNIPENNAWVDATYGAGQFVAVASDGTNRAATSDDGVTWTVHSMPAGAWQSVAFGDGTYVAVGSSGVAATSTDGENWTSRTIPSRNWNTVDFANGRFVAGAGSGGSNTNGLAYSDDAGASWVQVVHPVARPQSVAFGNGVWVAVGSDNAATVNDILYSFDGATWTGIESPNYGTHDGYSDVTFGNGLFLAIVSNVAATSFNGQDWTETTPSLPGAAHAAFSGDLLIVTSSNTATSNNLWTTPDGVTFTARTITANHSLQGVGCNVAASATPPGAVGGLTIISVLLTATQNLFGVGGVVARGVLGLMVFMLFIHFGARRGPVVAIAMAAAGAAVLFKLGLMDLWVAIVVALLALAFAAKRLG